MRVFIVQYRDVSDGSEVYLRVYATRQLAQAALAEQVAEVFGDCDWLEDDIAWSNGFDTVPEYLEHLDEMSDYSSDEDYFMLVDTAEITIEEHEVSS